MNTEEIRIELYSLALEIIKNIKTGETPITADLLHELREMAGI